MDLSPVEDLTVLEQTNSYNILTFQEDNAGNYQWGIGLPGIPRDTALNNPSFAFFRNIYVQESKVPPFRCPSTSFPDAVAYRALGSRNGGEVSQVEQ